MGEPAVPSIIERREALLLAERILDMIRSDEVVDAHLTDRDLWLLASTLIHARGAFQRMTPVYTSALALVRDDGTQDAKAWFALRDAVLAVKAELAKERDRG